MYLCFVGTETVTQYNGRGLYRVEADEVVKVSDEVGEALLADFPKWFKKSNKGAFTEQTEAREAVLAGLRPDEKVAPQHEAEVEVDPKGTSVDLAGGNKDDDPPDGDEDEDGDDPDGDD